MAQEAFAALGEGSVDVPETVRQEIERFLCKVYGKNNFSSSMDGSAMPSCF